MTDLSAAIKILKNGGIVIFPTDTVYGIGCRIDREKSIKRLLTIKKRPPAKAVPVLVDSIKMAKNFWRLPLPVEIENLLKNYWPGALTVVYFCRKNKTFQIIRGRNKTLGIRLPDSNLVRSLIKAVGVPLLGPSANFYQGKAPYRFEDLDPELISLSDWTVKGNCLGKKASTVVDCTKIPFKVLRQGVVKLELSDLKL
ncbi:MAG TPA: L-threonylcarbamoyladenylate synthase [Candidatus Humimicrobiaceae bacterium]|nr:L-threonylcarbamoyladenylate synthase [Candidatus Humimicrobiaceae bacterium]